MALFPGVIDLKNYGFRLLVDSLNSMRYMSGTGNGQIKMKSRLVLVSENLPQVQGASGRGTRVYNFYMTAAIEVPIFYKISIKYYKAGILNKAHGNLTRLLKIVYINPATELDPVAVKSSSRPQY
jgi:hypothetical protein